MVNLGATLGFGGVEDEAEESKKTRRTRWRVDIANKGHTLAQ